MSNLMDAEDRALDELKTKMTGQQRQDMADLLQKELKRRMVEKKRHEVSGNKNGRTGANSGKLDREHIGEIYSEIGDNLKNMRMKKLEEQLLDVRRKRATNSSVAGEKIKTVINQMLTPMFSAIKGASNGIKHNSGNSLELGNTILVLLVVGLAAAKIVFATGVVNADTANETQLVVNETTPQVEEAKIEKTNSNNNSDAFVYAKTNPQLANNSFSPLSDGEKQVITSLDARRVELERRKQALDEKEQELQAQNQIISERVAELRSLTERISKVREEKDTRYEARLEQLSNVYSSMGPKEAAPLIAKLDIDIALSLLERMPGKKIAQVLSAMEQERAIELTKSLTQLGKL